MLVDAALKPKDLTSSLNRFFGLASDKIATLDRRYRDPAKMGAPVFTERGKYVARAWTDWTQGFQYGCQLLQFDATADAAFLKRGRENTFHHMDVHVTHTGVHDHGFNNVSTYGNLRRLALEGRTKETPDALAFYELALKASGAVQAARWTALDETEGYIYSFNGPHSLFSDTIRSCRSLVLAHHLGGRPRGENDSPVCLLTRAARHIGATLKYNVFFGTGRDAYDVRGRVAHEGIFNVNDGNYRCPSTQQGYSPFTTWTRGLAWVLLGLAEELEFLDADRSAAKALLTLDKNARSAMLEGARATADFYIDNTASDGIPYWDTGAPGLVSLGDYLNCPSQVDNDHEPVDSSAAAIAAQGLLRLGRVLGVQKEGRRYYQAGLCVARTLFAAPYLSEDPRHEGLLLHSVYHRPRGWDYVPKGSKIPMGESSMWGDYHAMELAVYIQREATKGPYLTFFGPMERTRC